MEKGKLIRLNDNWVSVAIDNLDSFNDVGYLDFAFLDQVLPHCTKEQLAHIESCTKQVDLTPITDKLWRNFFERDFGGRAVDETTEKIMKIKIEVRWKELYEAKSRSLEKDEKEVGERVKMLYEKEKARKQSRQVQLVDKAPTSSKSTQGSIHKGRKGSKMMDKLKRQFEKSLEKKNLDFVKRKAAAAEYFDPIKKPRTTSIQAMNLNL